MIFPKISLVASALPGIEAELHNNPELSVMNLLSTFLFPKNENKLGDKPSKNT